MYAEKVQKWNRNGCQNASRINAKTGNGKYQEIHEKTCLCVKPCKSFILLSKNGVWQGECAGPENHEKTIKITSKSGSKLMKNRCENDARQNDAKIMENGSKMEPKRQPKSRKCVKNACRKRCRNLIPKRSTRRIDGGEVGGSLYYVFNIESTTRQY